MATKKELMYQQIQQHGENLNKIFNTGLDPIVLCKKLRKLELEATRLTEHECNTGEGKLPELAKILTAVKKILFKNETNMNLYLDVFINGDPRGYALKIKDKAAKDLTIHKDWGGYGILAPDFS